MAASSRPMLRWDKNSTRRRGPALARSRALAGTLLVAGAALTLTGPAIVDAVPALAPWMPFLCGTDLR
jgi:hypothetical protein